MYKGMVSEYFAIINLDTFRMAGEEYYFAVECWIDSRRQLGEEEVTVVWVKGKIMV